MDSRPRQAVLVETVGELLSASPAFEPPATLTERAAALATAHLLDFVKEVLRQGTVRGSSDGSAGTAHRALQPVLRAVKDRSLTAGAAGLPSSGAPSAAPSPTAGSAAQRGAQTLPFEALRKYIDVCGAEALAEPEAIRALAELRTFVRLLSGGAGSSSGVGARGTIPVPIGARSAATQGTGGGAAAQRRAPLYASMPLFRPQARQRRAPLAVARKGDSADIDTVLADAENETGGGRTGPLRDRAFPTHKDYVLQAPLAVTGALFDQQVRTMGGLYNSPSAEVEQATKVFVKIALDAWAQRIPLLAEYTYLREVSYGLLAALRELLGSQYGPVRKHCFNLLATLATHAQIVDRQEAFAGASAAVEAEIAWLLRRALEFTYLCADGADDFLWLAALKCCFIALPSPEDWAAVHVGALARMASVPVVAGGYPAAFDTLAQALALHAERAASAGSADVDASLRHLDGGSALVDLLAAAPTTESSTHLVRALAMLGRLLPIPGESHSAVERAWAALEAQRVPWCLHLLAAQPAGLAAPAIAKDLASSVVNDTERDPDVRQELAGIVTKLVVVVCAAQQVPQLILRTPLAELIDAVPSMLTDEADASLRRCGRQLIGFALRSQVLDSRLAGTVGPAAAKTAELMRSPHPKVLFSAAAMVRAAARLLCAAYPSSGRAALCAVASALLDPAKRVLPIGPVMALYRGTLETLCGVGPTEVVAGDISAMVLSGALHVCSDVFDMGLDVRLGPAPQQPQHLLWALYWALRKLPSSLRAVRDARHVTLALVCAQPKSIDWRWDGRHGIDLWHAVMQDAHAPCRILGAERLVRFAATAKANPDNAAYFYEQAATAGETAPHRMATLIYRSIVNRRPASAGPDGGGGGGVSPVPAMAITAPVASGSVVSGSASHLLSTSGAQGPMVESLSPLPVAVTSASPAVTPGTLQRAATGSSVSLAQHNNARSASRR